MTCCANTTSLFISDNGSVGRSHTGIDLSFCMKASRDISGMRQPQIIPQSDLAQPAVIIAPHADDEVLGCGGTIIRKVSAGAAVKVIYVTDSSRSHVRWVKPAAMAAKRKQEAIASADILGLAQEQLVFLDFPETQLESHGKKIIDKLGMQLRKKQPHSGQADRKHLQIFVPFYADRNLEHQLVNRLLWKAVEKAAPAFESTKTEITVFEYPVWFFNQWPWAAAKIARPGHVLRRINEILTSRRNLRRHFEHAVEIKDVILQKAQAMLAYHSQVNRPPGMNNYPVLDEVAGGKFLQCFFRKHEIFHKVNLRESQRGEQ